MVVTIKLGQLDDPRVVELLTAHVTRTRAETGRGSAHALDVSGLAAADICFWTAWDGEELLGTAALKRLSASHGEVKSMHTAEGARRRGVNGRFWGCCAEAAKEIEVGIAEPFRTSVRLGSPDLPFCSSPGAVAGLLELFGVTGYLLH